MKAKSFNHKKQKRFRVQKKHLRRKTLLSSHPLFKFQIQSKKRLIQQQLLQGIHYLKKRKISLNRNSITHLNM
jgi:hypothetical protein